MPNERDEFKLTYYNSLTCWIEIDGLLKAFGLNRSLLNDTEKGTKCSSKTCITSTYVHHNQRRQEAMGASSGRRLSSCPVREALGRDMTSLHDLDCQFFAVPIQRGQQLKDIEQLDGWVTRWLMELRQ